MRVRAYPRQVINLTAESLYSAFSSLLSASQESGQVAAFERQFSGMCGVSETVAVSSARLGLALVFEEFGIKPGDEVIFSAYTFHAMPNVTAALGITPVFADVRESDFNIDPACVQEAITGRTKAIVATHIYGQPAEMKALREISDDRGLFIIEDCAEATGARYRGKPVGSIGDAGLFSFSMGKPLVGFGGGAITTSSSNLAGRIHRRIGEFPLPSRVSLLKSVLSYAHLWFSSHPRSFVATTYPLLRLASLASTDIVDDILSGTRKREVRLKGVPDGMKMRFSGFHAEVLLNQLDGLDAMNRRRIAVGKAYDRTFRDAGGVALARLSPRNLNIYNAYGIRVARADLRELQRRLLKRGIDTKRRHMYVCSSMEMFSEFRKRCPVAECITGELLHLPINHHMGEEDARYITEAVLGAVKRS